ncbi:MAG: hypothetical protein ACYC27_17495, partial [Armatimonadota bacterium]
MEHPHDRRGFAPWLWILIVLGALILVLVIWWAVAAQSPEETVVVPDNGQTTIAPPPQQTPTTPQQPTQPVTVTRERPVNIYIEQREAQPRVIVVPKDEQPPEAKDRLRQLDLPGSFRYQDKVWEPSDQAVTGDTAELRDTGANIDGNVIYAQRSDTEPYDDLY